MDETERQKRLDLCRRLEEKVCETIETFNRRLVQMCRLNLQEALQQLEANLEQQLELICENTRSVSQAAIASLHVPPVRNILQQSKPNVTVNEVAPSTPNVNSNDDDWEFLPLRMQ